MKKRGYNMMVLAVAALFIMAMPAAAYTIDGYADDWGINPTNDLVNSDRLDDRSLIPASGISYVIENDNVDGAYGVSDNNTSNFTGPEWRDIEAVYADCNSTHIFVLIITSMPKTGMNWGSDHIQPGDLALDFNDDGIFEYGVKIVKNDDSGFGNVGEIYSNPTWAVLDPDTDPTEIASIVGGTLVTEKATICYTGTVGTIAGIPDGPLSTLPQDTFGDPARYGHPNPPIPNEIIEIAIPKTAFNMLTTANIRGAITRENGIIKLESVTLLPASATLLIPMISLLGRVFCTCRKKHE
ncbi:MAG: hypothetical protein U9Q68_08170 [Euryarchaeota archaeon]|nr:hypothetical protein [Euryarchaeota archaeon]